MIWGANVGLLAASILFVLGVVAMVLKSNMLDFVKANLGLFILVFLFVILLGISFHVFHEASANTLSKDFLAWLEQKAGEVLASIMTLVVSAKAANVRASDKGADGEMAAPSAATIPSSSSAAGTMPH